MSDRRGPATRRNGSGGGTSHVNGAGKEGNAALVAAARHAPEAPQASPPCSVVALGGGVGSIDALQRFFEQMPARSGIAFIVVVDVPPKRDHEVLEPLRRATRMPVLQVTDGVPLVPDHIQVVSPGPTVAIVDGVFTTTVPARPVGRHDAIDSLFRALATSHRERALAVVLSGTGADGAVGIARVKERGGLVFAQQPEDASRDSMPRAAIDTGQVDFVMTAGEMPERILDLVASSKGIVLPEPGIPGSATTIDPSAEAEQALREIMGQVRRTTGHDFAHYKRSTLLRRLERRMQVHAIQTLPAYREYLVSHPDENDALLQDLLIGVTNFFRDRESFEALERAVLPLLFQERRSDPIRVWVAGCATGEEAYTIAMQLRDLGESLQSGRDFQIFATDVNERALVTGRAGLYPLSIVADVPAARLRKHFVRENNRYRIHKALRERVLFARHNVLVDPPFSRIDLVCCRNLLIYVDRDAQRHVFDRFRFALRSDGYLFLGSSESADDTQDGFAAVDKKARLYRSAPKVVSRESHARAFDPSASAVGHDAPPRRRRETRYESLHREALEAFAPSSALIDASHEILHLTTGAGAYVEYGVGVPSHNLVTSIRPELRLELRSVLFQAGHTHRVVTGNPVRMRRDGRDVSVTITARPFHSGGEDELTIVVFDEADAPSSIAVARPVDGVLVEQLQQALVRHKEQLQQSMEEAEASTQDLKASNEELQAINEELRSAGEELETGKEELQSMYEELTAVNDELRMRIDEASSFNDDLQNLIASTDIATIFVDNAMFIKRYTPRALDLFKLVPQDVGRSLLDIRHRLNYDELAEDADAAFHTLRTVEREVDTEDGRRLLVRVLPYRTTANRIDGATITFVDVTNLRRAEQQLREGGAQLQIAAATTRDFAIMTMDEAGIITTWNQGAERTFGYTPDEIIGRPSELLFTPEDRAAGVPAAELGTARTTGRAEDDRWHLRKDQTRFYCSGVVTQFEADGLRGFAKIARDITGTRHELTARDALLIQERTKRLEHEATSRMRDEFLAVMSHELKHPLNLIHVNAELLTRMPQLRGLPSAERSAQVIRSAVMSQGKIIDDLLDLSRVRTGKLTLQMEPVELPATIEPLVVAAQADAAAKNIRLELRVDGDAPVVDGDPVRIEQIVWNLLSNALKFTPDGGSIEVRIDSDRSEARIAVTDTGRGIAADFLPKVFDMFGQENNQRNRVEGGMGIGLALVRELAYAQGGRVQAYSKGPGRGARFTVGLPLHDARRVEAARQAPSLSLAGLRILVVEDARDALEPFVDLLKLENATPTPARDGREALALLDGQDFDLIISDIAMADVGGYEFIAAVRKHPRANGVKAIALTGYGRAKDRQDAMDAGFDAHVTKPASIQDIQRVLEQIDRPSK